MEQRPFRQESGIVWRKEEARPLVSVSTLTLMAGWQEGHGTQKPVTQWTKANNLHGNWTTRRYANSWIANSWTGHLADWSTRELDNSRTSQLADWTSRGMDNSRSRRCRQKGKLSTQSRRWHPRVVQSATCTVRELSSPRVDKSARCPVRDSSSPRVGNPRVGVSPSCPVTSTLVRQNLRRYRHVCAPPIKFNHRTCL